MKISVNLSVAGLATLCFAGTAWADDASDQAAELAKKLANPVAALISVPMQLNYDSDIGSNDDGTKLQLNVQPVIPLTLNKDWNVISRTILPIIDQKDIPTNGSDEFGIGDITQSFFFSPKAPTKSGWVWGAGPVLTLPTASDDYMGTGKWGLGPTVVVLKQSGPWTVGGLWNHVWSVAGDSDRADVNASYFQPFLAYVTPKHTTFGLNSESTYNFETEEWSVPFNLTVAQMLKFGNQLVQVAVGVRYYAESSTGGAEGVGYRMQFTLLYPK